MNAVSASAKYRPGDRVIYRDLNAYNVARVDLVKERHLTCFPFKHCAGSYQQVRKRIRLDLVVGVLKSDTQALAATCKLNELMNRRDVRRPQADNWLSRQVGELTHGGPKGGAA